jgi:hypothetical protein
MERIIREDMRGAAMEDGDGQGIELRNVRKGEINPRIDRAGARSIRRPSAGEPEPGERMDPASRNRVLNIASKILFPDPEEVQRRDRETEAERARRLAFITDDGTSPPPSYKDHNSQTSASQSRSNSVGTINSITSPPAQVRSMLDL